MAAEKIKMAICYDFDGTLAPGNMQEYGFTEKVGYTNPKDFWKKAADIAVKQQADGILAYMQLMIKESKSQNVPFKREDFIKYGRAIKLFDGVKDWFDRISAYAAAKGIELKHFIISSGLKEMIEGTDIASKFEKIYASCFMYDANDAAEWPAVALNYTTKTQFIYRINKGVLDETDNKTINEYTPLEKRDIPFENIIYIGDGETDIPCMKTVKISGGHSVAVYSPFKKDAKKKIEHLITDNRVNIIAAADYSEGTVVDRYIKAVIDKVAADGALKVFEGK